MDWALHGPSDEMVNETDMEQGMSLDAKKGGALNCPVGQSDEWPWRARAMNCPVGRVMSGTSAMNGPVGRAMIGPAEPGQ
jgi:hypothetical protein